MSEILWILLGASLLKEASLFYASVCTCVSGFEVPAWWPGSLSFEK